MYKKDFKQIAKILRPYIINKDNTMYKSNMEALEIALQLAKYFRKEYLYFEYYVFLYNCGIDIPGIEAKKILKLYSSAKV